MIALTWVLDLPRATDIAAVRTRLEQGGTLGRPDGLLAGFFGVAEAGVEDASQSAIAHVSVWANSSRMGKFLWSDTMASFERDFARPSGRLWSVTSVQLDRARLANGTHLGLATAPGAVNGNLPDRVKGHMAATGLALAGRSTALSCRGIDPSTWDEASIEVWTGRPRGYAGRLFAVANAYAPPVAH